MRHSPAKWYVIANRARSSGRADYRNGVDHTEVARRASSFGAEAAAYAEHRPDYPAAALEWGLAPIRATRPTLAVLDLGAGTGKLTGGLIDAGVTVTAVEPDDAMRAELGRHYPTITALAGTAEAIPLPDASVDAVFAGQAMHWFDLDRALPEIRRVLRTPGVFVPIWNKPDLGVSWLAEFGRLAGSIGWSTDQEAEVYAALGVLGTVETAYFPHLHRRTADELLATISTYSHMLVMPPVERAAKLAQMRDFLLANPATANGPFDTPLVTMTIRVVQH